MSGNYKDLIKEGRAREYSECLYSGLCEGNFSGLQLKSPRLHIPLLFGYDVIHGHRTIFPIPLAQSCSWDLEAIEKSDRICRN